MTTQQLVRTTLARVGGYWRPLAGVARLLEELGELAELLASPAHDAAELASELADVWIITTAIADQFLGDVAEPGSPGSATASAPEDARRPLDVAAAPDDEFAPLVIAAAQIARIVNYYDGPKTPRSLDGWPSLNAAVAALHLRLADLALAHDVELAAAVADKLRTISARDAGRFPPAEHDPSTAPCLKRFRQTQTASHCTDASAGATADACAERLWGAPAWSARPAAANVAAIVPSLSAFTRAATRERIDGYVIPGPVIPGPAIADSVLAGAARAPGESAQPLQSLGAWAQAVLSELASQDPHRDAGGARLGGGADEEAGDRYDGMPLMGDARLTFNGVLLWARVLPAAPHSHPHPHPHLLLRPAGEGKDAL